jgi:hypothetical protein
MNLGELSVFERTENEPVDAFEAFVIYRDERITLVEVAAHVGVSTRTAERWSSEYNWVARRNAWVDHLDEVRRRKHENTIQKAEDYLMNNLQEIIQQSVVAALKENPDPRVLKDLLDRAGVGHRDSGGKSDPAIKFEMSQASLPDLMKLLAELAGR